LLAQQLRIPGQVWGSRHYAGRVDASKRSLAGNHMPQSRPEPKASQPTFLDGNPVFRNAFLFSSIESSNQSRGEQKPARKERNCIETRESVADLVEKIESFRHRALSFKMVRTMAQRKLSRSRRLSHGPAICRRSWSWKVRSDRRCAEQYRGTHPHSCIP
jgi:hypothetical protein